MKAEDVFRIVQKQGEVLDLHDEIIEKMLETLRVQNNTIEVLRRQVFSEDDGA